jgi:NitT/TauT family transport system permease protein
MKTVKSFLIIFVIWEIIAWWINNPLILPGIVDIWSMYPSLLQDTAFLHSIAATIGMLVNAWIYILLIVFVLLLSSVYSKHVRETVLLLSSALQPTPTFAWLPVFMLILGVNENSMIAMMVFAGLWTISLSYTITLEQSMKQWKKHCDNLELGVFKSTWLVYIPSMKNILLSNFKTAWNLSWRTLLALEVVYGAIGSHWGIGTYMITEKERMDVSEMYATLFVIMLFGILFNVIFDFFSSKGVKVRAS